MVMKSAALGDGGSRGSGRGPLQGQQALEAGQVGEAPQRRGQPHGLEGEAGGPGLL